MKKLMIAFAAAITAVVANAGAVQWCCSNIGDDTTAPYDGALAYLILDTSATLDNTTYLSALKGKTFEGAGTAGTVDWTEILQNVGSYSQDQTVYGYMILLNKDSLADYDEFKVSDVTSVTFGQSGNKPMNFTTDIGGKEWQAVPEPFSGTLALLGMVGIALRRKLKKAKKA